MWCVIGFAVALAIGLAARCALPRPVPKVVWDAAATTEKFPGFKYLMFPASPDISIFAPGGVPTSDELLRALCNSEWELEAARIGPAAAARQGAPGPTVGMIVYTAPEGERYARLADLRFFPPAGVDRDYLTAFDRSYRIRKYHDFVRSEFALSGPEGAREITLTFFFNDYVEEYRYGVDAAGKEHPLLHTVLISKGSGIRQALNIVYSLAIAAILTPLALLGLRATILRPIR